MSISGALYEKTCREQKEYDRILKENGKKAADEYSKKLTKQTIKDIKYTTSGSLIGAAVGSCIPIIGTVIGGTIGGYIGKMMYINSD